MKTQLSKPVRGHAKYTDEYKEQALALWRASGRSAAKVATELGIRPPLLYRWARAERPLANGSPPGSKRLGSVEALEAEIHRLWSWLGVRSWLGGSGSASLSTQKVVDLRSRLNSELRMLSRAGAFVRHSPRRAGSGQALHVARRSVRCQIFCPPNRVAAMNRGFPIRLLPGLLA